MKRIRKLFILFLTCCLLILTCSCTENKETEKKEQAQENEKVVQKTYSDDAIAIALLTPLQGELKALGQSLRKGALVAESLINEKKSKIRLIIKDTRGDPGIASELAKDAVEKEKAKIIVGTLNEKATIRVIHEIPAPFIYTSDGAVKTCQLKNSQVVAKNIWGLGLSKQMITEPFLINLSELHQEKQSPFKLSYFSENNYSLLEESDYIKRAAESFGFIFSGEKIVDPRIEDTFEKLQDIIAQKPDVLLVSLSQKKTSILLEQSSKLGIQPEIKIASLSSFVEESLSSNDSFKNGIITTTTYLNNLENAENMRFLKRWQEMFPESPKPTAMAARGFAAIAIAAKAIEIADQKKFNELKFNKAMNDLEISLPQGKVFISSKNHLTIQALYSSIFKDNQFQKLQFLGDISHPELEGCKIQEEQDSE